MTLDDIKVFLTIAKAGSLTAAAEALYVSQPALSKRLTKFEQELGSPLFERGQGARRLELTPAGRLFLPFAERWEALQQDFFMLHDINSRVHFFVSGTATIGEYALPQAVYSFTQQHPDVELVVSHHESRDCYSSVHDRLCDLAFVTQQHFYQNIITTPLWQEDMYLLRLNNGDSPDGLVDPALLDPAEEIVIPWNSDFMHWRQHQLSLSLHPSVTVCNMLQATPFLLQQNRWIIVPATVGDAALRHCPQLSLRPLIDPPPGRTVFWIEEAGRHHACTDELLELVRQEVALMPGVFCL